MASSLLEKYETPDVKSQAGRISGRFEESPLELNTIAPTKVIGTQILANYSENPTTIEFTGTGIENLTEVLNLKKPFEKNVNFNSDGLAKAK